MSMILYHGEPNGPSLAVLVALSECGVEAECRRIDLRAGDRHRIAGLSESVARDMGVEGEGPVLVVGGEAITESVFIAQFLDESGANTLQPKDAYAHWQMLMWCRRITERCAPAAAYLGCKAQGGASLGDAEGVIASEDLKARWNDMRADRFGEEKLGDSRIKVADAVKMVDDQLADGRDWLMGPLTIADFETYSWLAGMVKVLPDAFAGMDHATAWMARVKARPSVQWALAKASAPHPERSWAPGPEINRWG